MIRDVDETLSRLLAGELVKIPGCPVRSAEQITFDSPVVAEATLDGEAHVNLFLRDIRENMARREEGFYRVRERADKSVGVRRPATHIDLSYFVTVHAGDDPLVEHRLLSDVLGVLLRFLAVPDEWLTGTLAHLGPNAVPLEVALPEHTAGIDLPGLWQALGSKMRPTLSLLVTCPFDPYETRWTIAVREAVLGLGHGTGSQGPQRPLDVAEFRVCAAGIALRQDTEKPLSGVAITVDGHPEIVETDNDGFFRILNLTPGPHRLRFEKFGYRPHEAEVVVPNGGATDQWEPTVIALQALGDSDKASGIATRETGIRNALPLPENTKEQQLSVSGTLRYPDGRPAAYIPVRAGQQRTITDADGAYWFFNLAPDERQVFAEVPLTGDGTETLPSPSKT